MKIQVLIQESKKEKVLIRVIMDLLPQNMVQEINSRLEMVIQMFTY